jgi:hypothetical protein
MLIWSFGIWWLENQTNDEQSVGVSKYDLILDHCCWFPSLATVDQTDLSSWQNDPQWPELADLPWPWSLKAIGVRDKIMHVMRKKDTCEFTVGTCCKLAEFGEKFKRRRIMPNCGKTRRNLWLALAGCLCLGISLPAWAELRGVLNAAEETASSNGTPTTIFSGSPIDPVKPEKLAATFKAGDYIYCLIRTEKTWRDLLGEGSEDIKEIQVPIDMIVDGEKIDFQYITIKNKKAIDGKVLVLDIAPEPSKMTAYKDEGFAYGEGKGNRKIGPDQYTYNLSKLKPGKHTVKFQVRSYGDILSAGEFTIEGDDYKPYAELREKILKEMLNVGGMPQSQKTDVQLQAEMMKLLRNAGWKNIRVLVIVDKDWWIDRAAGGDSAVIGRHIGAAAAAKADDDTYYWSNLTFEQKKLIDGSFGPLELSHTGVKRPIKEENIDK